MKLKSIELDLLGLVSSSNANYSKKSGEEHYRLLFYMAQQINDSVIIDIGTETGYNALALSNNIKNKVYTFDAANLLSEYDKKNLWRNNVIYNNDNLFNEESRNKWKDTLLSSSLIFINKYLNNGTDEYVFYKWLKDNNYKGVLVVNGIWYHKYMRDNFWYNIPSSEKYDLTEVGNYYGTGAIVFDSQSFEIRLKVPERLPKPSSYRKTWTVVTSYFNMSRIPDSPNSMKTRNGKEFLKDAAMTMGLEQNLVVYCDYESVKILKAMRPAHLESKTKYITIEFSRLDSYTKYYQKIADVRNKTKYNVDIENTASYYLLCMTKYDLLLKTMINNPFNSTHFAWCDITIETKCWKNGIIFPKIWKEFRDKLSVCYIDYQPRSLAINNVKEYYRWGRCSMANGFFTGNKINMVSFCNEMIKAFEDMLSQDVGHTDEQLISIVYFRRPEIFEFYYGDYTEIIMNYGWMYERPNEPVRNLMKSIADSKENWPLLLDATERWLKSYSYGCFTTDESIVKTVKTYNTQAKLNIT
jgi:hypothetical protein